MSTTELAIYTATVRSPNSDHPHGWACVIKDNDDVIRSEFKPAADWEDIELLAVGTALRSLADAGRTNTKLAIYFASRRTPMLFTGTYEFDTATGGDRTRKLVARCQTLMDQIGGPDHPATINTVLDSFNPANRLVRTEWRKAYGGGFRPRKVTAV